MGKSTTPQELNDPTKQAKQDLPLFFNELAVPAGVRTQYLNTLKAIAWYGSNHRSDKTLLTLSLSTETGFTFLANGKPAEKEIAREIKNLVTKLEGPQFLWFDMTVLSKFGEAQERLCIIQCYEDNNGINDSIVGRLSTTLPAEIKDLIKKIS